MSNLKSCQLPIIFLYHIMLFFFNSGVYSKFSGSLKLIPWDSPDSPLYQPNLTQTQKIQMMVISSKQRASISSRTLDANKVQIPFHKTNLHYAVRIKIGNPTQTVNLLLDTGSGVIWTQCHDSESRYIPNRSRTYRPMPCQHPVCLGAKDICECIHDQCVCTLSYGTEDGTMRHVQGVLSFDSFTLPLRNNRSRTFPDIIFGCGPTAPYFDGILGMNKLPISMINQLEEKARGRYSYCLSSGSGYLSFGNDIPQVEGQVQSTQILYPSDETMYLKLTGISVGETRLEELSAHLFSKSQGGFHIDTGAQYTVLKRQAYNMVMQEFGNYYDHKLERVDKRMEYKLDFCYKHNHSRVGSYIGMTFHLQGANYVTNNLYLFPERGIMCIMLIPGRNSILGAAQQFNKRFIFDMNRSVMKFVDEDC
ncbi:hypothetical protein CASFOL_024460 [Castilleja foliolosa]|uniref:Peptidase A1 domain-containing protein n=1 Tax=Castilleja foliolosa TaxID=1961234 RepID=A0ABD3CNE2_9LAMI